jgi:Helicase HerA, central domain
VEVRVRPKDFVAHKTAVFGMTRAGKSNTMKVIASAVHLYAHKTGTNVGQLIFDPAGEYAYANRQDGTALAQLGDNVRIYRLGATKADRAKNVRLLSLNFFDHSQITGCWSLIESFFQGDTRKYIQKFLSCDPTHDPDAVDDPGDKNRLLAVRSMYFGILLNAGLEPHPDWRCRVPVNEKTRNLFGLSGGQTLFLNARELKSLSAKIAKVAARSSLKGDESEAVKMWVSDPAKGGHGDPSVDGLVGMLAASGSANGYKELRILRSYHSAESHADFAAAIYGDLARGRLVIVDLSRGSEQVLQTCADRVVNEILASASQRFREGHPSRPMQIFLEEAHRLLHRDKFSRVATSKDP